MVSASTFDLNDILHFVWPAGGLDWVFLIILVSIFVAGVAFAFVARAHMVSVSAGKWPSGISIHDVEEKLESKYLRWGMNLPGALVMIGLLGTFLGLGLAINEASSLYEERANKEEVEAQGTLLGRLAGGDSGSLIADDKDVSDGFLKRTEILNKEVQSVGSLMQRLRSVLANIGFKFRVSVWGLVLSIVLRLVVELVSGDHLRRKLALEIARSHEASRTISDVPQLLGRLVKSVDGISFQMKVLENFDKSTADVINRLVIFSDSIQKGEQKFADTISELNKLMGVLDSSAGKLSQTCRDMDLTIGKTKQFSSLMTRLEEMGKSMESSAGELQGAAEDLHDVVEAGAEEVSEQFSLGFSNAGAQLSKEVGRAMAEQMSPVFQRMEKMNSDMDSSTSALGLTISSLNAKVGTLADSAGSIEDAVSAMNSSVSILVSSQTQLMNQLKSSISDLNGGLDRVALRLATVSPPAQSRTAPADGSRGFGSAFGSSAEVPSPFSLHDGDLYSSRGDDRMGGVRGEFSGGGGERTPERWSGSASDPMASIGARNEASRSNRTYSRHDEQSSNSPQAQKIGPPPPSSSGRATPSAQPSANASAPSNMKSANSDIGSARVGAIGSKDSFSTMKAEQKAGSMSGIRSSTTPQTGMSNTGQVVSVSKTDESPGLVGRAFDAVTGIFRRR